METKQILQLLGGLALFLYGMQMMSQGLEAAAGNRMKQILEKLTANRFLGGSSRSRNYGNYPVFLCDHGHGSGIC